MNPLAKYKYSIGHMTDGRTGWMDGKVYQQVTPDNALAEAIPDKVCYHIGC